jgi:hypothetical protein
MLRLLFLHPLGPALILALGGLLIWLGSAMVRWLRSQGPALAILRPAVGDRLPGLRAFVGLLAVAGALAALVLLRAPPIQANLRWTWQPLTVAGSALDWRLDGWNWLAALLLLLLTAVSLLLQDLAAPQPAGGQRTERTLWLAAAAVAFVFSANTVTLASCWILLDGALALRLRPGEGAEPAGRAWAMLSLTGVLLLGVLALLGESGIRTMLASGAFTPLELALLWVIALVRAGVYPLHFWLTGPGRFDAGVRVALHLVAPTTGLWLLARIHGVAGPEWLRRPEWAALGALALLGTALAAWTADEESLRWRWIALNRASLVVMAAYVARESGPQALVWALVTFSLGSALLAVGQATAAHWGWRLPAGLAALALWGFPGTPGFLARAALVFPTDLATAIPLFVVVVAAETVFAAALWEAVQSKSPAQQASEARSTDSAALTRHNTPGLRPGWATLGRLTIAIALVAAPILAWGIAPQQLASLASLPASLTSPALIWTLQHARRSVWFGLFLSGLGGVALGILRPRVFGQMRGWQQGIAAIVSLEWLYRAAAAGLALAGAGLQYFAALGEGAGYLGWLALAGVILWVLLR